MYVPNAAYTSWKIFVFLFPVNINHTIAQVWKLTWNRNAPLLLLFEKWELLSIKKRFKLVTKSVRHIIVIIWDGVLNFGGWEKQRHFCDRFSCHLIGRKIEASCPLIGRGVWGPCPSQRHVPLTHKASPPVPYFRFSFFQRFLRAVGVSRGVCER